MSLYFEAHVTIEPVFDDRLTRFKEVCGWHGFRAAELLMKKRSTDLPERSQHDSFCTGRDQIYELLERRLRMLVQDLRREGFQVWRYKIEDTIIDSRHDDILHMITERPDDSQRTISLSGTTEPKCENSADHSVRASDPSGDDYIN